MMKRTPKTPALAKLAMLLLFAIAAVAILDTTSISAQELGRTITSPFGVANPYMNASDASESGSDGDTFVDPETGEVGHIIRNPFGVANPEGVDTGIDIPDSEKEVGGIITSPFGVPASDDIDTGVDVFDEDEEYLIRLPDDEESEVDESENVDEVDDETSDEGKELEEESAGTTTEKYVPVIDNPTRGGEYPSFNFKLEASAGGMTVSNETGSNTPIIYVLPGNSIQIRAVLLEGAWPSGAPTWTLTCQTYESLPYGVSDLSLPSDANGMQNLPLITVPNGMVFRRYTIIASAGNKSRSIQILVCGIDLQVDSNNDGVIDPWDSQLEDIETLPGKIIGVNNSDKDNDSIPDFADGFGGVTGINEGDSDYTELQAINSDFVEIRITLPDIIPINDNTKIQFQYSFSDPNDVETTLLDGNLHGLRHTITGDYEKVYKYTPAPGKIRIWKREEGLARSSQPITICPADGIINSGIQIPITLLGFTNSIRTVTLFLEAVDTVFRTPITANLSFVWENNNLTVSDTIYVTAIDPQLYVDGDWNGTINLSDPRDRHIDDFWINNDCDKKMWYNLLGFLESVFGYEVEDDYKVDSDTNPPNNSDEVINCLRDLEDFIRLKIVHDTDMLPASIKQCLSFSLRTYYPNGVRLFNYENDGIAYLFNLEVAEALLNETSNTPVDLDNLPLNDTESCFLFEAKNIVDRIIFEIKIGTTIIAKDVINVKARDVSEYVYMKQIYPRGNLTSVDYDYHGRSIDFMEDKDMLLFIHGMNMGGIDDNYSARVWAETIFKRLKHLGFRGTVTGIKWDDKGRLEYNTSENNAWNSASSLSQYIQNLSSCYNVNILAHSQGNVLAGQALRILPPNTVKKYIATQAAISAHVYGDMVDSNLNSAGQTSTISATPDIYRYYHSGSPFYLNENTHDSDKPYLDRVLGNTSTNNYFNRDDYALSWWLYNNSLKNIFHIYSYEGFNYYKKTLTGTQLVVLNDSLDGDSDDRFDLFSFGAPSPSHAMGTGSIRTQSGNLISDYNLKEEIFDLLSPGKTDSHLYHSWQFRQTTHETLVYWNRLVNDCSFSCYSTLYYHFQQH